MDKFVIMQKMKLAAQLLQQAEKLTDAIDANLAKHAQKAA